MTDDKTNPSSADRSRVAGGEDYEVQHFAARLGIAARRGNRAPREDVAIWVKYVSFCGEWHGDHSSRGEPLRSVG